MARYIMIALNGPTSGEGDEDSYNQWYDEVHLAELKSVEGVTSARRYKVSRGNVPGMEAWPYLALYEIETDDYAAVSRAMGAKLSGFHPTFDKSRSTFIMAAQISGDA